MKDKILPTLEKTAYSIEEAEKSIESLTKIQKELLVSFDRLSSQKFWKRIFDVKSLTQYALATDRITDDILRIKDAMINDYDSAKGIAQIKDVFSLEFFRPLEQTLEKFQKDNKDFKYDATNKALQPLLRSIELKNKKYDELGELEKQNIRTERKTNAALAYVINLNKKKETENQKKNNSKPVVSETEIKSPSEAIGRNLQSVKQLTRGLFENFFDAPEIISNILKMQLFNAIEFTMKKVAKGFDKLVIPIIKVLKSPISSLVNLTKITTGFVFELGRDIKKVFSVVGNSFKKIKMTTEKDATNTSQSITTSAVNIIPLVFGTIFKSIMRIIPGVAIAGLGVMFSEQIKEFLKEYTGKLFGANAKEIVNGIDEKQFTSVIENAGIGAGIGATLGSMVGGPVGAIVGLMLGAGIGAIGTIMKGWFDQSKGETTTEKLGDMAMSYIKNMGFGTLVGAGIGTTIGTFGGPIGMLVGGILGAVIGAAVDGLFALFSGSSLGQKTVAAISSAGDAIYNSILTPIGQFIDSIVKWKWLDNESFVKWKDDTGTIMLKWVDDIKNWFVDVFVNTPKKWLESLKSAFSFDTPEQTAAKKIKDDEEKANSEAVKKLKEKAEIDKLYMVLDRYTKENQNLSNIKIFPSSTVVAPQTNINSSTNNQTISVPLSPIDMMSLAQRRF